jgi:hypothetical protein
MVTGRRRCIGTLFLFLNELAGGGSAIPLDLETADDVCDGKLVDNKKEIS